MGYLQMRLAKYLARAGVASRRRAENIISQGRVTVNGTLSTQPQDQVQQGDVVTVDGRVVAETAIKYYILLNKPAGFISTVFDTHNRPTVTDLISGITERVYPVGRLDADTRGLLLLTNDGELAYRLTHPSYRVIKIYQALVEGKPDRQSLEKICRGIAIEGRKSAPAKVKVVASGHDSPDSLLQLSLTEGRKRQVKKMCSAIGHPVKRLMRVEFAGLRLGNLPEGQWRHLTDSEVKELYRLVKLN